MLHIEAMLRKGIGLDAASIGSSLIERTVRMRMKLHGLKLIADYKRLLRAAPEEFNELIEAIVVTETWFFRDREPFNAFTQIVKADWLPKHPEQQMRILSVPCASGEEPFSLAMSLLDADVAPERFQIDAVDISQTALSRAARAVYGKNSFRGTDLGFRDRHFHEVKDGFAINPDLRRQVRFQRANVLDDGFLTDALPYDFIFCRNLLIYFDRATQTVALGKLHRLLAADGMLFVGPAELPLVTECGFASAGLPHAFACHKGVIPKSSAAARRQTTAPRPLKSDTTRIPTANDHPAGATKLTPAAPLRNNPAAHPNSATLILARRLADTGQFQDAAQLCRNHLHAHPDSAECYYLLGLVQDAADDPQAIELYRKALYLDPAHAEALAQAALWFEKHGDPTSAERYKRRLDRIIQTRPVQLKGDSQIS